MQSFPNTKKTGLHQHRREVTTPKLAIHGSQKLMEALAATKNPFSDDKKTKNNKK